MSSGCSPVPNLKSGRNNQRMMNWTRNERVFRCSLFGLLSLLAISVCLTALMMQPVGAEELDMVNRPVNVSGLTGLLVTTSPFILPLKTFEFSIGALSEKSNRPDYSLNELPSITLSAGVSENSELALKGSLVQETLADSTRERGTGNTELSWKYSLYPQLETSSVPAVAVMVSAVAAGSNKDLKLNGVLHWGARIGLSAGREISWGDYVLGLYADGQLIVHDLNNDQVRDRYGLMNAGLLLPISKYRNLQMILEYSLSNGIDRETQRGGDYSALLYGLRMVTERFNLSIGSQFVRKQVEGFNNTSRIIGIMSFKL